MYEEERKIALADGIIPNFDLIKTYYPELNEDRFFCHYVYYKNRVTIAELNKILASYNLLNHKNDIFYFLVELGQVFEFNIWAKDISLANAHFQHSVQLVKMVDFFSKILTMNKIVPHDERLKSPAIKEIKFITDKGIHLTIDSYPLCYDIVTMLEKEYLNRKQHHEKGISKKPNINPRQYHKNSILSLRPFINFLKTEAKNVFPSNNKVYSFIAEILSTLPYGLDLDFEAIKKVLNSNKITDENPQ